MTFAELVCGLPSSGAQLTCHLTSCWVCSRKCFDGLAAALRGHYPALLLHHWTSSACLTDLPPLWLVLHPGWGDVQVITRAFLPNFWPRSSLIRITATASWPGVTSTDDGEDGESSSEGEEEEAAQEPQQKKSKQQQQQKGVQEKHKNESQANGNAASERQQPGASTSGKGGEASGGSAKGQKGGFFARTPDGTTFTATSFADLQVPLCTPQADRLQSTKSLFLGLYFWLVASSEACAIASVPPYFPLSFTLPNQVPAARAFLQFSMQSHGFRKPHAHTTFQTKCIAFCGNPYLGIAFSLWICLLGVSAATYFNLSI
eukprot:1140275-Pelagomonas_calceolata.AAC.1